MIFLIIVICILFVVGFVQSNRIDDLNEKYRIEKQNNFDIQQELDHYTQLCIDLQQQLDELQQPRVDDDQPTEQGNFVKRHRVTRATAETYRNVFDLDVNGIRILEHLTQTFCRDAFTDSERETCHRLGQQSVINFIVNNINRANDPNYKESVND